MKLIMSPQECAEAMQTSRQTIFNLIESGELPAYRQGRNWKIPIRGVEEYVMERAKAEAQERKANGK